MINNKLKDNRRSPLKTIMSIFKLISLRKSELVKATEKRLKRFEIEHEESHKKKVLKLVERYGIKNTDGTKIKDPELALVIFKKFKLDDPNTEDLLEKANIYNLDITEFLQKQKHKTDAKQRLKEFR
jgi:hypothetical protein